jgi:hypothetical protein
MYLLLLLLQVRAAPCLRMKHGEVMLVQAMDEAHALPQLGLAAAPPLKLDSFRPVLSGLHIPM